MTDITIKRKASGYEVVNKKKVKKQYDVSTELVTGIIDALREKFTDLKWKYTAKADTKGDTITIKVDPDPSQEHGLVIVRVIHRMIRNEMSDKGIGSEIVSSDFLP